MKKIVFSDIHGCNKTFNKLLGKINPSKEDSFYFLGDYMDRGPDSKGVLDTIFQLKEDGFKVVCLKGNHEQMFLDAYLTGDQTSKSSWVRHGGLETMISYDAYTMLDIPEKYIYTIDKMQPIHFEEEFIMVHAGLNFDFENPLKDKTSMIWIRDWYKNIDYSWLDERYIIHGHTPQSLDKIQEMAKRIHTNQYMNIDGGCCYGGYLCCYDMNNFELYFEKCVD